MKFVKFVAKVRLLYILLSPTFGMHQYTAGLANQMALAGHDVHLLTTTHCPRDRYAPDITIHTPINTRNTGFSADGLRFWAIPNLKFEILNLKSDIVHFTGPHLWNPILLMGLRRAGIPTIHTIHDVNPHAGAGYGRLLYAWNDLVYRWADHILIHGQTFRDQLVAQGVSPDRVTHIPLLHLFLSYESAVSYQQSAISYQQSAISGQPSAISYQSPAVSNSQFTINHSQLTINNSSFILFFARLEPYKGVNVLVEAMRLIETSAPLLPPSSFLLPPSSFLPPPSATAIIAGKGNLSKLALGPLPANVEIRNRLIEDDEAIELFSRCSLVVLPYVEASQSALIAAAYFFAKPVVVTRVGALPEYVLEGETGWVVPPGNPRALAQCLQAALGDPARLAQMGQAGRAWYDRHIRLEEGLLPRMYREMIK